MISDEPRDWPPLPESGWKPPPYSLFDLALFAVALALLIPLAAKLIEHLVRGTP